MIEKDLLEVHKRQLESLMREKELSNLELIDKDFLAVYTYDAISMEGKNKVPFEKVKTLITKGTISGYSEREGKEILNHIEAFNLILSYLKNNKDLTEEQVKDLHELLVKDIFIGGVYRNLNIQITGAMHQPPDHIKVYDRMGKLFDKINDSELTDLDKGIYIHAQIAKIHPFLDGNGRLTRLILNYYLMKAGYIPITIPLALREEYFKNIDTFKIEKNIEPLTNFIMKLLNERYEKLIEKLEVWVLI